MAAVFLRLVMSSSRWRYSRFNLLVNSFCYAYRTFVLILYLTFSFLMSKSPSCYCASNWFRTSWTNSRFSAHICVISIVGSLLFINVFFSLSVQVDIVQFYSVVRRMLYLW